MRRVGNEIRLVLLLLQSTIISGVSIDVMELVALAVGVVVSRILG